MLNESTHPESSSGVPSADVANAIASSGVAPKLTPPIPSSSSTRSPVGGDVLSVVFGGDVVRVVLGPEDVVSPDDVVVVSPGTVVVVSPGTVVVVSPGTVVSEGADVVVVTDAGGVVAAVASSVPRVTMKSTRRISAAAPNQESTRMRVSRGFTAMTLKDSPVTESRRTARREPLVRSSQDPG
jgi:hypothetical protein